jgi:hypothetical protein
MLANITLSIAFKLWNMVITAFTVVARVVVLLLNWTMLPRPRTGHPGPAAVSCWLALNIALFGWSLVLLPTHDQLWAATTLAVVHFLVIATALLVITEENDVWSGYVRYDRVGGKDERTFKHGKIVKSPWLLLVSGAFYVLYCAVALKAWHSRSAVLNVSYNPDIHIVRYIAVVARQLPVADPLVKLLDLNTGMEFQGTTGTAIKFVIDAVNTTIIVGTINSYLRQKNQLRRLTVALGAQRGNIPVLQAQAARAPDEIKAAILGMALHDPNRIIRRRAMTVAKYANILTFPTTMIYHLHHETSESNKLHALAVCSQIIGHNRGNLEPEYFEALDRKVEFQLLKRKCHGDKVRVALLDLRALVGASRGSIRSRAAA